MPGLVRSMLLLLAMGTAIAGRTWQRRATWAERRLRAAVDASLRRTARERARLDGELARVRQATSARDRATAGRLRPLIAQLVALRAKVKAALSREAELAGRLDRIGRRWRSMLAEWERQERSARELQEKERQRRQRLVRKWYSGPETAGKVLRSSDDQQACEVDLGRGQRVVEGLRLEVFRWRQGGKKLPRARIEILQVGEATSRARVLSRYHRGRWLGLADRNPLSDRTLRELRADPLGPEDLLHNRLFDKDRRREFVIAGRLTIPGGTARIVEHGDVLKPRSGDETDFLVLGQGYEADPVFKQARELGVPLLSERELLRMLGQD